MKRATFIKSAIGTVLGTFIARNVIASSYNKPSKYGNVMDIFRGFAHFGVKNADIVLSRKDWENMSRSMNDWLVVGSCGSYKYENAIGDEIQQVYVNSCMFNIILKPDED